MTRDDLLTFLRRHRLAVAASVNADGAPEAAVVGFGISDQFEIVFDTLATTRKTINLQRNPKAAVVIGWDEEVTAQIEGTADEPQGDELARLKQVYFAAYPDGPEREKWRNITYFRVRTSWLRYSDYRPASYAITEWRAAELGISH
jgi:hypothetical protein